jgi:hypothetical protein
MRPATVTPVRPSTILMILLLPLALQVGCATLSAKRVGIECPEDTKPARQERPEGALRICCSFAADAGSDAALHGDYAVICKESRTGLLPAIEDVCERGEFDHGELVESLFLRENGSVWRKCRWEDGERLCFDYDPAGNGTARRKESIAGFEVTKVTSFDPVGTRTGTTYLDGDLELISCPVEITLSHRAVVLDGDPGDDTCRGCEWMPREAPWSLGLARGEVEEITIRCSPAGPARSWIRIPPEARGTDDGDARWVRVGEGAMEGNQRTGTWTTYYEDGGPLSVEVHNGDRTHTTLFHPGGSRSAEGTTVAGHREGEWSIVTAEGTWTGRYDGGQEQGIWTLTSESGDRSSVEYLNGEIVE